MSENLGKDEYLRFSLELRGKFNPSILDKVWMAGNKLFSDEEVQSFKNIMFTDEQSYFESQFFQFTCNRERLSVKSHSLATSSITVKFVVALLALLNHTRITTSITSLYGHFIPGVDLESFFQQFNIGQIGSLAIDKFEDYIFHSDGKVIRIGRCGSDDSHLIIHIQSKTKFDSLIETSPVIGHISENDNIHMDYFNLMAEILKTIENGKMYS